MNTDAASKYLDRRSQAGGKARAIKRSSLQRDEFCGSSEREQRSAPTPSTWTLFEEPYWLDCVAPGAWGAVEITREGGIIARLPYVLKKSYGLTALTQPPLTPWLGPWMTVNSLKDGRRLGQQHQLLRELVGQLPKATRTLIACAPEYTNLHALHAEGWSLGLRYTYRIECTSNLDLIWSRFTKTARYECNKASQKLEVVTGPDQLPNLIHCLSKTFERQNLGHEFAPIVSALERVESGLGPREQRTVLTAIDAKGRPHASMLLVFDERHVFVVLRGSDEKLHSSGANSLLIAEAIRFASKHSLILDFVGSMIPTVERFNRSFGPRQVPVHTAMKEPQLLNLAEGLAARFTRLK